MKIALLETSMVGRAQAGHEVVVGTRNVQHTMARTEPNAKGTSPFLQLSQPISGSFTGRLGENYQVVAFEERCAKHAT